MAPAIFTVPSALRVAASAMSRSRPRLRKMRSASSRESVGGSSVPGGTTSSACAFPTPRKDTERKQRIQSGEGRGIRAPSESMLATGYQQESRHLVPEDGPGRGARRTKESFGWDSKILSVRKTNPMQNAAARTTRLRELPGWVRTTIEAQRERSEPTNHRDRKPCKGSDDAEGVGAGLRPIQIAIANGTFKSPFLFGLRARLRLPFGLVLVLVLVPVLVEVRASGSGPGSGSRRETSGRALCRLQVIEHASQRRRSQRPDQVVNGATPHRFDDGLDGRIDAHHDHLHAGPRRAQAVDQVQAIPSLARYADQREIEFIASDLDRPIRRSAVAHDAAEPSEPHGQRRADVPLVFDDQHPGRPAHPGRASWTELHRVLLSVDPGGR